MPKALLLFISFLWLTTASAQSLKYNTKKLKIQALRIGIDPLKSASMLAYEKMPDKHSFYFQNIEFHGELTGNIRTSFVVEGGYATAHRRVMKTTLDYFSNGWFGRLGFNYKLTEHNLKYESGLGWRVGINKFEEKSFIRLWGNSWNSELIQPMQNHGMTMWGEVLFYHNVPLFHESKFLRNLWFGMDLRLRLMNQKLTPEAIKGYSIPGFGEKKKIMPGVHFRLFYQIHKNNTLIKKHLNDTPNFKK